MDSLGASRECGESVVSIVDGFDWIDSSDWPALFVVVVGFDSGKGLSGSTRLGLAGSAGPLLLANSVLVDGC